MINEKCPRCGEMQLRIEPAEDSFAKDLKCLSCGYRIALKDWKKTLPF